MDHEFAARTDGLNGRGDGLYRDPRRQADPEPQHERTRPGDRVETRARWGSAASVISIPPIQVTITRGSRHCESASPEGFSFDAHYTWSRVMTHSIGDISTLNGPQDNNNLSIEKGPAPFDIPHRFTADFLYELPFREAIRFIWSGFKTVAGRLADCRNLCSRKWKSFLHCSGWLAPESANRPRRWECLYRRW